MKTCIIVAILLSSANVFGQQPVSKEPNKVSLVESSAVFWAGTAFDHLSSRGRIEGNPILPNANGYLNAPRFYVMNGVIFGLTVIFQGRCPRTMNWTRRILGSIHFGLGVHNFKQPKGVLR